jgi:polar amino acid transport system permease protein
MLSRTFGLNELIYVLQGAGWTIVLTLIALAGGSIVGGVTALARIARYRWLRLLSGVYVQLIQGTPLLMQLFVVYFGLALLGHNIPALLAASIVMILYAGAFLGEIWKGCLQAVPSGQWTASRALGLNRAQQLYYVVVPQALRLSIPPSMGFAVQLLKNTSIASLIGLIELTRAGQQMHNITFDAVKSFGAVGVIYFILCFPLLVWSRKLERKLHAGRAPVRGS